MLLFLLNIFSLPERLTGSLRGTKPGGNSALLAVMLGLLALPGALQAGPIKPDTIEDLDRQFQDYSRDFYRQVIKTRLFALQKYKTIAELKSRVDTLLKSGDTSHALALIHFNFELIRNNIDALETVHLTGLLLDLNDWHGAKRIFSTARNEGGKVAVSNLSYVFAKYFMARKEWQQALAHLQGVINDLSDDDANYARIMVGTILQYQKQHRKAVTYYQKVSKHSRYYPTAVLNTAVAYIRQDWWTDAYILINELVKDDSLHVNDTMIDRLHLVLGYALLRKQYFRNSREAFRNVGLNSPYTNRALLGIALTAANQEDFIGSLNAITILKNRKSTDLTVDEAYLLLPYTYGKLKQNLTATSAYTDGIKYYQERIAALQNISRSDESILAKLRISPDKTSISIDNNEFDYSQYYPKSFFDNYEQLVRLGKHAGSISSLQSKYQALFSVHRKTLASICRHLLDERIDYLQSYLNQSRYGLARLYDSSLVSTK